MSVLTSAYDAMITKLGTALSGHKRMTNPYIPEQNSELLLKQAYGLSIAEAINSNREIGCDRYFIQRDMIVRISRKFYALENDVTSKATTEKLLLDDDLVAVLDAFENDRNLGVDGVVDLQYTADQGLEFVFGDKENFLLLQTTFRMEYFESIS